MADKKVFTVNTNTEEHTRLVREPFSWPENVESWLWENARLDADREAVVVLTWNCKGDW